LGERERIGKWNQSQSKKLLPQDESSFRKRERRGGKVEEGKGVTHGNSIGEVILRKRKDVYDSRQAKNGRKKQRITRDAWSRGLGE